MAAQTAPTRDAQGRFVEKDPPLVVVNNPLTPFKKWWKKVMGNEGIDFRFTIHPLTAIAIASVIGVGSFGLGRISFPAPHPIVRYIPQLAAAPTPDPYRKTAFTGTLRYSSVSRTFYLQTDDAEAITLEVPTGLSLSKLVGKRIFATGKLNIETGVLVVSEATDLEILPNEATYLPGVSPKPSPTTTTPTSEPSPIPTPSPEPTPTDSADPSLETTGGE